ncbi:MAG TPA: helix-turn-helix domain-containing protein [Steroidobacteraceae bacterium]|nr:helix-turn-helix domain-containing protein [Steroidobacteraceae bacterium]
MSSRSSQRKAEEKSNPRAAILDATERIMLEAGYAAVSSRKVATRAGLRSQLLHYYFRTMDDLFIAVFQRLEDQHDEHFARAAASDHPIRELWKLSMNPASTGLVLEFTALATHRKAIRALIERSARRDRSMHVAAITGIMGRGGIGAQDLSPAVGLSPTVLALLMASVARTLVTESALGVSDGHAEMLAFVERQLRRMESR